MEETKTKPASDKIIGILKLSQEELGIIALLRNLKPYDIMTIAVNQDATRWSTEIVRKERTVIIIDRQSKDTNLTPTI